MTSAQDKARNLMWIAWENHRRTRELCNFLEVEPHIFVNNAPRIIKHPRFIINTLKTIERHKPKVLIVQNPSILLALVACIGHRIYGYKLMVDFHNAGLIPERRILKGLGRIHRFVQREADISIVTNRFLAKIVEANRGRPFVLPDKLPSPPIPTKVNLKGKYNLMSICTYGTDEPYRELIDAAKYLKDDIHIYITGNYNKIRPNFIRNVPNSITLTGFLSEEEYWNLMFSSDLVIDLTNRDNCLVCGAYEAVAVGTPLLLSDTAALREYFDKGVVYSLNNSSELLKNILNSIEMLDSLKAEILKLREELDKKWMVQGNQLKYEIKKGFLH